MADLALAADLQGGLVEHGIHLGLLLRSSLGLEQRQRLGDVDGTEHGSLEVLKLLVEIGIDGAVLPRCTEISNHLKRVPTSSHLLIDPRSYIGKAAAT